MFDTPESIIAETDWRGTLSPGDIVLFRFPLAEAEAGGARPKSRPCLVLEIPPIAATRSAVLAYGTSVRSRTNFGHEIIVKQPSSLLLAGLDKPTSFIGARRLIVSLDHPGFDLSNAHATPVIGRLDADLMERMACVRTHIQAMADIRAAKRREQREELARWKAEGRGFSEHNRALRAPNALKKGALK